MKPTDLRGILQYIPRFREKTFIISVDGAIVTDENFANILLDVAVLRSLNIRVVLAHGAAAQVKALAEEQHVKASDLDGSGITDAETLKLALTAANRLTHEILEGLSANDLRAAYVNAIVAHPLGILNGIDHLFTGKVERVDVDLLQTLLAQGIVPVIPPLGFDGDGKTYRLNSDSVAVAVADALKATKLIYITTAEGLFYQGQLIRQMLVADLSATVAKSDFPAELASKARHAVAACTAGVQRVHIINGRVDEGLLAEVFSNEGIGTLIYANEYQQIRPAKKKDIRSIQVLTKSSVQSSELLKRTRNMIEKQLQDYYIFEIDKNPVACVALHVYPEQKVGELACLYVNTSHENQGIGKKLIQYVEKRSREMGLNELITLSTQAFNYFQSKAGFIEGTPDALPPVRREKYDASGRNSKVLIKKLSETPASSPLPLTV
ncbi:amino-acid N-acetyltransferase [Pedosphaera parvula]|uniref:amino-acid N-acetyltransferase n=1 Tax=Pedosphaera parvula (strain Ellin514) TaxID=320771 RepID=B9XDU0_PEDPL|nr:amino-acid N-acetyltransferase [Pedosphaera parvula]EEF61831.1 amino-acid N-acetyltransferase [Pedosphaera parvula Ellin514]